MEPKFEKGRDTVESTPPLIIPVEAQTGPWALNVSKSGEAAAASSEARAAELEQFYAEGTTPLAETTPAIKVDGDRTQLTEAQMSGVVGEVLDQTLTEDATGPIGFDWTQTQLNSLQDKVRELEAVNTKIIAALKHLGLDTNKHFR